MNNDDEVSQIYIATDWFFQHINSCGEAKFEIKSREDAEPNGTYSEYQVLSISAFPLKMQIKSISFQNNYLIHSHLL